MRTHNIPSYENRKDIPIIPSDLALLSVLTGLNVPFSYRTNFHGPKGVRAIEVRLISWAVWLMASIKFLNIIYFFHNAEYFILKNL